MRQHKLWGRLSVLGIFLWSFSFVGVMSCGSGGDSSSSVGTSDDAKSATSGVLNIFDIMSNDHPPASESANPSQQNLNTRLSSVSSLSDSLTATSTSSCSEGSTTAVWGSAVDLVVTGASIVSGGSGTVHFQADGISTSFEALMTFDSFNAGDNTLNMTFDGMIGSTVTTTSAGSQVTITGTLTSNDFIIGFIQNGSTKICDVVVNILDTAIITDHGTSVTFTESTSGCVSVCNFAFTIGGGRSGTL